MSLFKKRFLKTVSVFMLINFLAEIVFPTAVYALTSGPKQPEFSSFEPVATTNMVNEFSGSFTYNLPMVNIPGPNGGGYALSLSYHSGTSPEEQASWVGYGWSLNPGAILRGKKGFPDDFNGDDVTYINRVPKNWTASVGLKGGMEIYSMELGLNASAAVRYNSYKGFGTVYSVGLAIYQGLASVNYTVSGEEGHSFTADINPAALLAGKERRKAKEARKEYDRIGGGKENATKRSEALTAYRKAMSAYLKKSGNKIGGALGDMASTYGMHALGDEFRPSNVNKYNAYSMNIAFNLGGDPTPLHIGVKGGLFGSYSEQESEESKTNDVYGFLYLGNAGNTSASDRMLDYAVEKESHYNKRDNYLSIPYQSPDQFSVTGEGLGGGFRLFSRKVGHYMPREVTSHTTIGNVGLDFTAGLDIQPFTGFNVGLGFHSLKMQNWYDQGNTPDYSFSNGGDEHHFFRFNNDMGGNVTYSASDEPYKASIVNIDNVPGAKRYRPDINAGAVASELSSRTGRSSYIGYHTNSEMLDSKYNASAGRNIYLRSFTKDNPSLTDDAWDMVDRSAGGIGSRIGEIASYNEEGNRYVYGLPVYAAKEISKSYSVKDFGTAAPQMVSNLIAYKEVSNGTTKSEVGEVRNAPYAHSYLLTEITTPDYIDRTFDGPTSDDFGGWTRFNYKRGKDKNGNDYGNADKSNTAGWYKWRFPYNGLFYDRGELCDPRDDMGNMSSGVKEIYYLKSIETRTHIAYFVTNKTNLQLAHSSGTPITLQGSGQVRKDGLGAASDANADTDKSAKDDNQELERLEKIVVYAKNENNQLVGKPLKTVNLEYTYELCGNLPNNIHYNPSGAVHPDGGKLTLKKVWFEYEGIVHAKVAPYEFTYAYKPSGQFKSADLIAKYNNNTDQDKDIIGYGEYWDQNPNYDPAGLDAWGNLGYQTAYRHTQMKPWLYQGNTNGFDAAAWQLKVIRLPSGGEIHVQYEQHEYAYVQDKEALAMISLSEPAWSQSKDEVSSNNKYYINTQDIELDLNGNYQVDDNELTAYAAKCSTYLAGNKVHFRFLYKLIGGSDPNINGCGSEYITGYTQATVTADLNPATRGIYLSFPSGDYTVPRKVCLDYVTRNKSGLNLDDNCDVARDAMSEGNPITMVKGLVNRLGTDFRGGANNCKKISLMDSYFRLPLMKAKKGGGIRVKRILMYDAGLEPGTNGDEVLYGTEYIYKNEDGTSSGVATNEPSGIRDENALVSFLDKRAPQTLASKIISGTDKENFEGPLGESLLPSPSVGYSRIVSRNIHSGKSGTGYKVSEYYTYKDPEFAFSNAMKVTEVDEHAKDYMYLPAIWVNVKVDNKWLAQGYSFTLNNMHGQLKRMATYGGDYVPGNENNSFKSFEEVYEYYKPGEKVPVMDEQGNISEQFMGKEEDVTMEIKSVDDIQNDASLQVDFSVGIALFIPIFNFSLFPYYAYTEKKLRTHITTKVISYPSIVKQVTTTQNGIIHSKEYRAFSKYTGKPLVTVEHDGFHGLNMQQSAAHKGTYTNYTVPAYMIYRNFGQKARNQGYIKSLSASLSAAGNGKYTFPLPDAGLISSGILVEGDLLRLSNGSDAALYYISAFNGTTVELQAFTLTSALNAFDKMEVVNSGYNNLLNADAASLTTYGKDYSSSALPVSPLSISGNNVSLSDLDNVLAVNVKTYGDAWSHAHVNEQYGITTAQNPNDFETARRGKWRVQSSYTYKEDVKDGVTGNNRIYNNAGVFNDFHGFNYSNPAANDQNWWLRTNLVTAYSPHGEALEEQDIMGIKSTARFSHKESMPALIAQNAAYTSVLFRSFEDVAGASVSAAHSGSASWEVLPATSYTAGAVILDDQVRNYGLSAKLWLRAADAFDLTFFESFISQGNVTRKGSLKQIARVGDWTLLEVKFKDLYSGFSNGDAMNITFKNNYTSEIWIDDIRIQPMDARASCYVYDKDNLRLLTSFDDQHFGLYYQYNAEGKLVRKLVETERGLKVITETQYNIPVK